MSNLIRTVTAENAKEIPILEHMKDVYESCIGHLSTEKAKSVKILL